MDKLKVSELRAIAKERRLKGYYKMKKDELVNLIGNVTVPTINVLDENVPLSSSVTLKNHAPVVEKTKKSGFWNRMKETTKQVSNQV